VYEKKDFRLVTDVITANIEPPGTPLPSFALKRNYCSIWVQASCQQEPLR